MRKFGPAIRLVLALRRTSPWGIQSRQMDGWCGTPLRFGSRRWAADRVLRHPSQTTNSDPRERAGSPQVRSRERGTLFEDSYLVDSASSHMLVSKIKPCMSKYKQLYGETANGSLNQLSFI